MKNLLKTLLLKILYLKHPGCKISGYDPDFRWVDKTFSTEEKLTFAHVGGVGDILFSLYFCRELASSRGEEQFRYLIFAGKNGLPLAAAEFLQPLLAAQKFISGCEIVEKTDEKHIMLNDYRKLKWNFSSADIRSWYYNLSRIHLPREFWKPVIEVNADQKYQDKINLMMGIEADAFGQTPDDVFDYTIGSVHYLPVKGEFLSVFDLNPKKIFALDESKEVFLKLLSEGFDNDILAVAKCYFDTVVDMVQKTKPTIIGHFDLISLYGDFGKVQSEYEQIAKDAVKRLAGCGSLVEINGNRKFKGRGGLYPADFLIKEFAQKGFDFVLSSDAHVTASLGFEFDETVSHLKTLGITRLASFDKKGNRIYTEI